MIERIPKMEVEVNTQPNYQVKIENHLFQTIGKEIHHYWTPRKVMVVTDYTVQSLYYDELQEQLQKEGFEVFLFSFPEGERNKSLEIAEQLYEGLAEQGFNRGDGIIALGGGVVGDLTGFVAATYMRGIPFLQIPTTLLAQVDSSIGGKTAVNLPFGKNLVGAFYQPDVVFIDPIMLQTLEWPYLAEGLAEVIKMAMIGDKELWEHLQRLPLEKEAFFAQLPYIITRACQQKADIVTEDPYDYGLRRKLNFGHTIAHALEAIDDYKGLRHGAAVAIGMVAILQLAYKEHWIENETMIEELIQLLEKFHLPTEYDEVGMDEIFEYIVRDKKGMQDEITLVLVNEIGQSFFKTISYEELWEILE